MGDTTVLSLGGDDDGTRGQTQLLSPDPITPISCSSGAMTPMSARDFVIQAPSVNVFKNEDIVRTEKLGSGGFGTVYMGIHRHVHVAIKEINGHPSDSMLQEFVEEVKVFNELRHPSCVNFLGICVEPPCIVIELMPGGDLANFLYGVHECEPLSYEHALTLLFDISLGLEYLHSRGIPHRDVKPKNVLLTENFRHAKLSDFGLSGMRRNMNLGGAGSRGYAAPEVIVHHKTADAASDVYSLAVVVMEVLTRQPAARPENAYALPGRLPVPSDPAIVAWVDGAWSADPTARPTAAALVELLAKRIDTPVVKSPKESIHGTNGFPAAARRPMDALSLPRSSASPFNAILPSPTPAHTCSPASPASANQQAPCVPANGPEMARSSIGVNGTASSARPPRHPKAAPSIEIPSAPVFQMGSASSAAPATTATTAGPPRRTPPPLPAQTATPPTTVRTRQGNNTPSPNYPFGKPFASPGAAPNSESTSARPLRAPSPSASPACGPRPVPPPSPSPSAPSPRIHKFVRSTSDHALSGLGVPVTPLQRHPVAPLGSFPEEDTASEDSSAAGTVTSGHSSYHSSRLRAAPFYDPDRRAGSNNGSSGGALTTNDKPALSPVYGLGSTLVSPLATSGSEFGSISPLAAGTPKSGEGRAFGFEHLDGPTTPTGQDGSARMPRSRRM